MKKPGAVLLAMTFSCCALLAPASAQNPTRNIHVFVALADNQYQGIVPVPAALGDGDDPGRNLYWGAAFGVKTFFKASKDWQLESCGSGPKPAILERCIFRNSSSAVYLVADAYRGREIRAAVLDFLSAAAGAAHEVANLKSRAGDISLHIAGDSNLIAYVGHDAFMDFQLSPVLATKMAKSTPVIVLACASKSYFARYVKAAGAQPLLWTTNLMAPEAYTLKAALDGWIAHESEQQIRQRAAGAYSKYQKCSQAAALRLLVSGW